MVKRILLLLPFLLTPVAAPASEGFNAAAAYVTAGQDEPGYRAWVGADPLRPIRVKAFNDYLVVNGVGGVAPTWQLIRTASDWQKCGDQPFEVPPSEHWPNIVQALRYIGAFIEPVIGDVEPVSAYRNPSLNVCAKGAATSTHLTGGAIDMVPTRPVAREVLMEKLCRYPACQRIVERHWPWLLQGASLPHRRTQGSRMGNGGCCWRLWLRGGSA